MSLVKDNFIAFLIGYSSYEESIKKTIKGETIKIPIDFLIETKNKMDNNEDGFLDECLERAKNAMDEAKIKGKEVEKEDIHNKGYGKLQGSGSEDFINWYVYLDNKFKYTVIVETKDKKRGIVKQHQGVDSIFGNDIIDTKIVDDLIGECIKEIKKEYENKTTMPTEEKRIRGFEVVRDELRKHPEAEIKLPKRGSSCSSCYDIYMPVKVVIKPHEYSDLIFTDICTYMKNDEVLMIHVRSSMGIERGLVIANTTPIIDSDYYFADNGGNIGLKFYNRSDKEIVIEAGERVCQGMFVKYLLADNDEYIEEKRTGGIGHTGTK